MNRESYPYIRDHINGKYVFFSKGLNGVIRKIVRFKNIAGDLFNLILTDWDEFLQEHDSNVRSNNNDRDTVMSTVIEIILDFTKDFPNRYIIVQGNTPSRTRLYQMVISAAWIEIDPLLEIKGSIDEEWLPFEKNKNYEAFIVRRK